MMNANGGNILWVQNAFGEWIGLFNAWCFLTSCIVSQALLIYSYLQYLQLFFEFSPVIRWVLGIIFVAISFLVNIWGINYLSRLSWVMFGLIFLPFIMINFYIPFGHPRINVNFSNMLFIPSEKDINWSVLISTVVWNLEGYDSLGSVAGEVKGGKKVFIAGILATFHSISLNYFPYWLGISMAISSILANFGGMATGQSGQ